MQPNQQLFKYFVGLSAVVLLGTTSQAKADVLYSFQSPAVPLQTPSGLSFGPFQFEYFAPDFITADLPPYISGNALAYQFSNSGPIALVSIIPGPIYTPEVQIFVKNSFGGYSGLTFEFLSSDTLNQYGSYISISNDLSVGDAILTLTEADLPVSAPEPATPRSIALALACGGTICLLRKRR